jgi:hypothetical protein
MANGVSIIRSVRWFVCLLVLATSQVPAADGNWRMVDTPQYRVLSQLRDAETIGWMRDFDQFILSTSDVLQLDVKALPPLTVVIFDRDKGYAPYKLLRPNGRIANVNGQFIRRQTWSMIGMAHASDNAELRRVLQHEATHWLMSADQARQPAWFAEGIAEMLSTFERHGDTVNWAKPIGPHLALLRRSGTTPLAEFLIEPDAISDNDNRTDRFYAQAWLFTHFMMMSKDTSRRQVLFKFLQTFRTESGEATVNAVFGPSLGDVEHDFKMYLDQASYAVIKLPVKPVQAPPSPQTAPSALVEAALGALAFGAGHEDLARTHAEKAIALDAKAPDGHAVLAYLSLQNRDFDNAAAYAEQALQLGSKDSDLFMLLGDSYLHGKNAFKPDARQQRVTMYENAINLSPRRLAIYERLTDAIFAVDKPREEDARFLALGLQAFPGQDWLRVGSAVVDNRLGHGAAAMKSIEAALRPDGTLDGAQRNYAAGLRAKWLLDRMKVEMDAAVAKNDFPGAHAIVATYRERIGKDGDVTGFLDETDGQIEVRELVSRFDAAFHANKKAQAQAVAEKLLSRPDVPGSLKRYLQEGLRQLK